MVEMRLKRVSKKRHCNAHYSAGRNMCASHGREHVCKKEQHSGKHECICTYKW